MLIDTGGLEGLDRGGIGGGRDGCGTLILGELPSSQTRESSPRVSRDEDTLTP